jgi:septum formation protein
MQKLLVGKMGMSKYKIILSSNSPRRKELLQGLDLDFEVKVIPGIKESYPQNLLVEEIPQYIAAKKATAYHINKDELVITADTIVVLDGLIMGKPKDEKDANNMLHLLSGHTHQVITGVCLTTVSQQKCFATCTEVTFKTLTDQEINYYVSNYHPLDKAGAYGIQEWIGYIGVKSIKGSYFNVMGLPVQKIYEEINKFVD